jgi:hypothetical protein
MGKSLPWKDNHSLINLLLTAPGVQEPGAGRMDRFAGSERTSGRGPFHQGIAWRCRFSFRAGEHHAREALADAARTRYGVELWAGRRYLLLEPLLC